MQHGDLRCHAASFLVGHRPLAAEHRLSSTNSVVVEHGLSCPSACGILLPQPGIECAFPALQGGVLTTGPPGKRPGSCLTRFLLSFLKKSISLPLPNLSSLSRVFIHLQDNPPGLPRKIAPFPAQWGEVMEKETSASVPQKWVS